MAKRNTVQSKAAAPVATEPVAEATTPATETPEAAEAVEETTGRVYNRYAPLPDAEAEVERAQKALTAAEKRLAKATAEKAPKHLIHRYTVRIARFQRHYVEAAAAAAGIDLTAEAAATAEKEAKTA